MSQQIAFSRTKLVTGNEPVFGDMNQYVSVEDHPDQNGLQALRYVDGSGWASYFSGSWKKIPPGDRPGSGERFLVNGNTLSAYREGQGDNEFSVFACQSAVFMP